MAAVDPKPNASPVLSAVDWIDKVQKIVKEALSNEETPFFIKSTLDRELNRLLERLQDARTQIHQGSADSPAVGVVSFSLETVGSLRVKISALGQGNHKTESIELVAEDEDELEQLLEEARDAVALGDVVLSELVSIEQEVLLRGPFRHASANDIVSEPRNETQTRINKLQKYNEIKDIAQELMGFVAETRGVPVATLYETREFGVGPKD